MKLQAREIVRKCKKMSRSISDRCAVGTIAKSVGIQYRYPFELTEIAQRVGTSIDNLEALEFGFSADFVPRDCPEDRRDKLKRNRYYKVGRNTAKLAGLPLN